MCGVSDVCEFVRDGSLPRPVQCVQALRALSDENWKIFQRHETLAQFFVQLNNEVFPLATSCFSLMTHHFFFSSTSMLPTRYLRRGMTKFLIISYNLCYISKMWSQVTSVSAVLWYGKKSHRRLFWTRARYCCSFSVGQDDEYSLIFHHSSNPDFFLQSHFLPVEFKVNSFDWYFRSDRFCWRVRSRFFTAREYYTNRKLRGFLLSMEVSTTSCTIKTSRNQVTMLRST